MARDLVRLSDVAKAAGVSQGTASNVFSRPDLVRPEVRERVKETAKKLGYAGPDPRGRLLRAGKSNAIGVATAEPLSYFFEDPFARLLMQGISEACDKHGAGLALVSTQNEERLAWNIQSALVDGFVLLCIDNGEKLVELTRERQLPFVALALGKPDETVSAIGIDDYAGAQLAARHLAELGHRRFGVLALELDEVHEGPVGEAQLAAATYSTTRERATGYLEELALYGVERDRIPVYETRSTRDSVRRGLDHILTGAERPTAILAMSDRVAMFAIEELAARGLRVPEDISIVGFDGVPEAATCIPPLTTVAQPIAEIGRRAVKAILEGDGSVHRETLPVELIVRESTRAAS
ncbi:LacI family DNA-binding transcriptional regulator [Devosia sp. ZB163]|uniref:LacI family DNA-binding transcriptional regulator n=1 Tax=Devosia sp. ZB163 TaxID=3025938 RepID=UPI00235F1D3A|nr:LacI family DNA-binding transcriptional regulator [Devosia sp. ZB163]MDC9822530.1 LacI family DNA-binding transcriptional regulator [Devosia sp. ZB163]